MFWIWTSSLGASKRCFATPSLWASVGPAEAKIYLNKGRWGTTYKARVTKEIMDLAVKEGDTQSMIFASDTPPPFQGWEAERSDKVVGEKTGGYAGKAKGVKQALWERGWWVKGMAAAAKDANMNVMTAGKFAGNQEWEDSAAAHGRAEGIL